MVAADVLSTNHNILQALMEGGCKEKVEEEKKEDSDEEMDDAKAENKMVQSILSKDSVSSNFIFKVKFCYSKTIRRKNS